MDKYNFGFQSPVSLIMEGIIDFHNHIFFFLVLIFVFVFWLFPLFDNVARTEFLSVQHFSHSVELEVVWTIVPSLILVAIAIPSFALLYAMDEVIDPGLTLKVVGHQWYWSYQYSDCTSEFPYDAIDRADQFPVTAWEKLWFESKVFFDLKRFVADTYLPRGVDRAVYKEELRELLSKGDSKYQVLMSTKLRILVYVLKNDLVRISPMRVRFMAHPAHGYSPASVKLSFGPSLHQYEWFHVNGVKSFLLYNLQHCLIRPVCVDQTSAVEFDSYMLGDNELRKFGDYRLLEVDEPIVLPVGVNIRLLVTADDVIHSYGLPSFGVKLDAVPGRLNQQGIYMVRQGTYYGQCSELCGVNHGFMPTVIKGTVLKEFLFWFLNKLYIDLVDPSQLENFVQSRVVYRNVGSVLSRLYTDYDRVYRRVYALIVRRAVERRVFAEFESGTSRAWDAALRSPTLPPGTKSFLRVCVNFLTGRPELSRFEHFTMKEGGIMGVPGFKIVIWDKSYFTELMAPYLAHIPGIAENMSMRHATFRVVPAGGAAAVPPPPPPQVVPPPAPPPPPPPQQGGAQYSSPLSSASSSPSSSPTSSPESSPVLPHKVKSKIKS